jgi:uncharacterized repeat protein (TIGR01451 family)
MKRQVSLTILATFSGVLISLFFLLPAGAQINAFTFFIPYPTGILDDQFNEGYADADLISYDIETVISIAVRRYGTVIYYDNWEDGFEANLTNPTQSTTWVWGDGNPANNGEFANTPADDILTEGYIIELRNRVPLVGDDGQRDPSDDYPDGRDAMASVNGAIAVTLAVWPRSPDDTGIDPDSLYAGAWELFPTGSWGQDYRIPVGEDLAPEDASPTSPTRAGFRVVGLNVTAVEDNTTVELDLNADGAADTTEILNRGDQLTRIGSQVGIDPDESVLVGAQVLASAPVQVHVFTADPAATWEARAYTMFPFDFLEDEWLAPRASDGDFWLYNPSEDALTVEVRTSTAPLDTITIPGRSTIKYPAPGLSGATGAHFKSTDRRPFDGVVALSADDARDWGYPIFPVSALTSLALVGWAPGNNLPDPPDAPTLEGREGSRVYATALNATTIHVIFDLSDGSLPVDYPVAPLEEVSIIDEDDYDMTGAVLYTDGEPFAAVWGQDQTAPAAQPSIDAGTGIVPLASMAVQKTITLIDDADGSGDISWGDTLRFEIYTVNNTNLILADAVISDTLPPTVDYVWQSSTVRGDFIPDDSPPRTIFPFDEGGYPVGELLPTEAVTGTFDAVIKDGVEEVCNTAGGDSPSVPVPPDDAMACVPVVPSIVTPTPTPTPVPPTPTPGPTDTPEPPDTPEPAPPTPTLTATPVATVTPEPTLPVLYLPETGTKESQTGLEVWEIFLLLVIGLAALVVGSKLMRGESR